MRVLVVDDDDSSLTLLQLALTQAGYEVITATNGKDALEIIREGNCRLVVSDWEMPEMTGVELCRAVRADHSAGYVYILLLTGHDSPEERVRGLRAGADDFVGKPCDISELIARIGAAERVLSLETRDVAIFAMAKLAESRDPETGAHLERVRSYSRVLAQHLGGLDKFHKIITPEFARLIYQTSSLHDIGKVAIPDSVLLKPGKLTEREFEIMKTHTRIGEETLGAALNEFPNVAFLEMGRDIAASHHERYDGHGYPRQLAGDDIPLCARIVTLADVYDALCSRRVYKSELPHEVARAMIVNESGKHFDPDVVDAFLQTEAQFVAIRDHFAEAAVEAA